MTENTAKFAGGAMIKMKYYDIVNRKRSRYDENKSGDEIAADIVKRAGLELA